jgi:hypothetical protein
MNRQTLRPDKIVINLSTHYERFPDDPLEIPEELYTEDNVIINMVDDRGPATKLLGLSKLDLNPEDVIIVIDDDRFHLDNFVEEMVLLYNASPDAVSQRMVSSLDTIQGTSKRWGNTVLSKKLEPFLRSTVRWHDLREKGVYGFAAFIVKRKLLDKLYMDVGSPGAFITPEIEKVCRQVDDDLFSGYFEKQGIDVKYKMFEVPDKQWVTDNKTDETDTSALSADYWKRRTNTQACARLIDKTYPTSK